MPPNGVAVESGATNAARPLLVGRRRFADALARLVVSVGGLTAIVGIVAIFGVICREVYPLWKAPTASVAAKFDIADVNNLIAPVTEEYRQIIELVGAQGAVRFVSADNGSTIRDVEIPHLNGAS